MNGWGWRGGWLLAVGSSLLSAVCQGELGHRIGLGRMEREGRDSDLSHGAKYGSRFIARHRECRSQNIVAIYV